MKIFLTGGARGIGKAIKIFFEDRGHIVISPDRNQLDLSNTKNVSTYLNKLEHDFDVLINNAGVNYIQEIKEVQLNTINETFEINTISPFLLAQYFAEKIFKPKKFGRIINIGTIWLSKKKNGRTIYAMSKSALQSMTESFAIEYAEFNILTNMVSPGYVNTELTNKNNTIEALKEIKNKIPVKRIAEPVEIASLIYNLVVNNNYITGQNIYIDGGFCKSI